MLINKMAIVCGLLFVPLLLIPVFAETQTLSTEKGALEVKLTYDEIEPNTQTKIGIDFINPQTQKIQEHIDYTIKVSKYGEIIFGPPLTHTSTGSVKIPIGFNRGEGVYSMDIKVEGILFQPIPKETAVFEIDASKTEINLNPSSFSINNVKELEHHTSEKYRKKILSWFKHVAFWWSNDTISTGEYMASTAYLIKENMIMTENKITQTDDMSYDKLSIPAWIKNGAEWWGNGQITNDEFLNGIEHLVANGIAFPSTQSSSFLSNLFDVERISTVDGLKVVWTNSDFQSHTITSGTIDTADEFFNSKMIQPDQSFSFIFKKEGSYPYFCMIHPWEYAELSVTSSDLTLFYEEKIRLEEEKNLEEKIKKQKEIDKIISETVITNPKDVQNSEFYDINTECQLKYFLYKDPAKTSEIYSLIRQNEQQIEQEYFSRASKMGDNVLLREIGAEIIMEQYSINHVLKDNVIVISAQEISQKEIQQIQQGTHLCEEEFDLYPSSFYPLSEDTGNSLLATKTPFDETPINGAEVGQWVKYQFEITGSNESMRNSIINSFSRSFSGANFDFDDVEWLKREVIDMSGNKITIQEEYKVRGKTSLFTETQTYDFPIYGTGMLFVPINVEKGDILTRDITFGDMTVVDFQKKNYSGKYIDTIHVTASDEYHQAGKFVKSYIKNYYDKKTGMLLEAQFGGQSTAPPNPYDLNFQMKAIDFHTPSNNIAEGGGCLIATATFGSELAPQVQQLRELRDNKLLNTESGSAFMESFNQFYYSFSPVIADYERENPLFREAVKIAITPMISSLSVLNYVDVDSEATVLGWGISLIILNVGMYFVVPVIVIVKLRQKINFTSLS